MVKFYYIIKKEILMVKRDPHSLAVLFLLPVAFILIMSLAMQDLFTLHTDKKIRVLVASHDASQLAKSFIDDLKRQEMYAITNTTQTQRNALVREMYAGKYTFCLVLTKTFTEQLCGRKKKQQKPIELLAQPTVNGHIGLVVKNNIAEKYIGLRLKTIMKGKEGLLGYVGLTQGDMLKKMDSFVATTYAYKNNKRKVIPSSVQQNVPAWLVFSIFFIVVPISNTFITERNYGTYDRMKSMHVAYAMILAGKMVPYIIINIVQALTMFLIGMYIVPLLGGDALRICGSIAGLGIMTVSISFCAIAYALLIATIAKTTEQATVIGGFGNIILGALGGIMVPTFVMPEIMQKIAKLSPMAWGLEGFLELLLRNGNISDILSEVLLLFSVGFIMLLITWIIMKVKLI